MFRFLLTKEPIELQSLYCAAPAPECGASAHFTGWVRNHHEGKQVSHLVYTSYEALSYKLAEQILASCQERFPIDSAQIIHRIGKLEIGEAAVAIAVTSAHRREALAACQFLIDTIKTTLPIWKEEFAPDGSSSFVACHGCHSHRSH